MNYQIVVHNDVESLLVFIDDLPELIAPTHINYQHIKNYLIDGGDDSDEIRTLLNAKRYIPAQLQRLSERISLIDGELTYDGDKIDNALSRHIVSLAREGDTGYLAFVRFMDKLAQNPSRISRIQLFPWVDRQEFTITQDGDIVAYKSVRNDNRNGSHYVGIEDVLVDGVVHRGIIPNTVGSIIEIARNSVDPNRDSLCSVGLHVATWNYATQQYPNGKILKVIVNPRDVVSIPRDHNDEKMRVCRYRVDSVIQEPVNKSLDYSVNTWDNDVEWDDEDDYEDFIW